MKQFYEPNSLELGIDEAGRGCLMGPVVVASVILGDLEEPPPYKIRDSKKCSVKQRKILREYIEENAIAFNVQFVQREEIDKVNIYSILSSKDNFILKIKNLKKKITKKS